MPGSTTVASNRSCRAGAFDLPLVPIELMRRPADHLWGIL